MIGDQVHPIMVSDDAGVRISAYIRERRMLSAMLEPHDMGPLVLIADDRNFSDECMDDMFHRNHISYGMGPGIFEKEKPAGTSLVMRLLSRI
jgi:hypothetical protein